MRARAAFLAALFAAGLAGCSGGGGAACTGACAGGTPAVPAALSGDDVRRVLAQAVGEAQARGLHAVVAVVDRVGNVLAVFRMDGAPATVVLDGGRGTQGGFDAIPPGIVPASLAAIAKAVTGAYLSSAGHAFSTRTAGQIVQEHFDPGEAQQPAGPLYGVQFSQLACSDVMLDASHGSAGPKPSALGLAADPGGLPLYKDGVLVGGVGVEADGVYGIDRQIADFDTDGEELAALAGTSGYAPPDDIRAERITVNGRALRYVDAADLAADPARAPAFAALPGALAAVPGYNAGVVHAGTALGTTASGMRPDDGAFAALGASVLVDGAGTPRFPPRGASPGGGSLTAQEVRALVSEALAVAAHARAQIRRPLGATAKVTVAVVDLNGEILALARAPDAPIFGIDVAVQKARTVAYFSAPDARDAAAAFPPAHPLDGSPDTDLAAYLDAASAFVGDAAAFRGGVAWSARAIANLHRPFYPDGIEGAAAGPLSTPYGRWSVLALGLQSDLVFNQVVKSIGGDPSIGCAARAPAGSAAPDTGLPRLRDGIQVFPGGVPIYRGAVLAGGIGVSGDGVDQDDMIAFLGLAHAGAALGTGLGNAPPALRADRLAPLGVAPRYVQCPQAPFADSTVQDACAGL